jgi:DNA repair protein RecN (Recombination protein N)
LCVTHLPQLASYGDRHFHVSKHVKGQRTASEVRLLADETVRVNEIAAMIGGTGESVVQSARDILDEAEHRKAELRQPAQPQVQKKML